ncbi:enoyl-CoA hydratase/isomerase family protein [Oesophagostomum dentatum]|uniref:Enoyl-CoA hydratase/isomerase family protein n=1 Tax=Oesophagostomum dentatum TaxID=61180 RepID=A0A0B1RQM5_OESDE|nr:enoyl-CoA hydratase/isomerase family protein [Oesophagostomum dentatum]
MYYEMDEMLTTLLRDLDGDDSVGAIVITGSQKAFSSGADINEMAKVEFAQIFRNKILEEWTTVMNGLSKPSIAAVNGIIFQVFPVEQVVNEAVKLAEKIAEQSPLMVQMTKEAINAAYDTTLSEGLKYEHLLSRATFATVVALLIRCRAVSDIF